MTDYLPGSIKYLNTLLGEQLTEGEGGGGETWQTVFEGSVTTVDDDGVNEGRIEGNYQFDADTIKVTFNGVEYTCPKLDSNSYGAPLEETGFDFSEYPFNVMCDDLLGGILVRTQTAGTYTLKIEEPQSGGSSDFSTAEVTFNGIGQGSFIDVQFAEALEAEDDYPATSYGRNQVTDGTYNIILYKGLAELEIGNPDINATASGAVTTEDNLLFEITGDCTITIS